jgi:5S rRNA maturation endonuclease (ribonuclease M5)
MIQNHIKEIALDLLGEPNKKLSTDKELRFGTYGSMSVDLEKGTFFSHEDNEGGGTIDLVKRYVNDHVDYLKKYEEPKTRDNIKDIYPYTDKDGKTLYEVVRFEPKTFRPRRMNGTGYVWNLHGVVQVPYRLKDIYDRRDEVIYIVEGEKDANTIVQKLGYVATTNCFGASNWKPEINSHFSGRDCVIVPDNDDEGRKHAEKVVEQLKSVCSSLKVVHLPVANQKEDITDYFGWLGSKEEFDKLVKDAPSIKCKPESTVPFQSWTVVDAMTIPPRRFLYDNHYIRNFASITIATGGVGKSTLCLTEMIAMATGRNLLGVEPPQRLKVLYFNGEDPIEEIQRRCVATCEHFGVPQEELVDHLYIASGRDYDLLLSEGFEGEINEGSFKLLEDFCKDKSIDVFCADPLANMTTSGETNEVFRTLAKRLSDLADSCGISIELVHHTRKGNGLDTNVESARGGSSLIAAVRSARVLSPMTKEEADKAGLESHVNHFRVEVGKSNLARPMDKALWFEKKSHALDNGDSCAVLMKWEFPDAFSGMSVELGRKIQRRIESERPKHSPRAENWAGKIIIEMLELDIKDSDKLARSKASTILKEWVRTGVVEVYEDHDGRQGRMTKFYCQGNKILEE